MKEKTHMEKDRTKIHKRKRKRKNLPWLKAEHTQLEYVQLAKTTTWKVQERKMNTK